MIKPKQTNIKLLQYDVSIIQQTTTCSDQLKIFTIYKLKQNS